MEVVLLVLLVVGLILAVYSFFDGFSTGLNDMEQLYVKQCREKGGVPVFGNGINCASQGFIDLHFTE